MITIEIEETNPAFYKGTVRPLEEIPDREPLFTIKVKFDPPLSEHSNSLEDHRRVELLWKALRSWLTKWQDAVAA